MNDFRKVDARHDDNLVAIHVEFFDSLAQNLLATPVAIYIRSIEGVDAVLVSELDVLERLLLLEKPVLPLRRTVRHTS